MTKRQTILLLSITAICAAVILTIFIWKFHPVKVAAEPISTATSNILISADLASETQKETNSLSQWPTLTPRFLSAATSTPNPIRYNQVEIKAEIPTQQPSPTPEEIKFTPTLIPTEIPSELTTFNATSAEDISPFSIGKSVLGTDLWMYKFGNGPKQKLIIAGIHGGYEYNTTDLANELISHIQENPKVIPEDTTLYILPSFNPDGLIRSYGYAGRANENNVDLNRNWDFNWKSTWNPAGCWAYLPIGGGTAPFSEPETAALRDFIHTHNISALISYHSAALGIFPGGAPDTDTSVPLAEAVAKVAPSYPYPPIQTGCEITGQFVDYASSFGIPALDIELTNHKDSDFGINLEVLRVFLNW